MGRVCPLCGKVVEPTKFGGEKANGRRPRRFPPHKRPVLGVWCDAGGWELVSDEAREAAVQPQLIRLDVGGG